MFQRKSPRFKYGTNDRCPVTMVGEKPDSSPFTRAAEAFDEAVVELGFDSPNQDHLLSEEQAKEAWMKAIETVSDWVSDPETVGTEKHVEAAKDVAREFGWLDDE